MPTVCLYIMGNTLCLALEVFISAAEECRSQEWPTFCSQEYLEVPFVLDLIICSYSLWEGFL